MGRNAYDQFFANEGLGDVDIVGDEAVLVDQTPAGDEMKFKQRTFARGDLIHFGIGRFGIAPNPLPNGAQQLYTEDPNDPFKPDSISFPSYLAPDVYLAEARIGSVTLIDGAPINITTLSEVAIKGKVAWPTAQTSQAIRLQALNQSGSPINFCATSQGRRLRGG